MFRTVPLSIIRSFSLYTQKWYMSYRFADSLQAGSWTLHVSDSSSVHRQEFFTVHTVMVYVIQVCWQLCEQDQDGTSSSCSQAVWHIPLLSVQWKTPDNGQWNCPKHVEFYSKNQFEKLVHLVGFIIRIPSYTCGLEMNKLYFFPGFCVLTAMMLKTQWYDDVTFCRLAGISRRFGGI